ncbi:hypothetical protein KRR38_30945 [Novosphingobium sp. G106]|uniref:DUF308 domain-containing protein n=1 Tax=Novosphingobium sp. G106 TaxID=2849500 RepID=UPI001C2CE647|nr:DUF308 domain-containing protein [Novosphingobium sp. G106]MBV1691965.1 hypothetical protein [Novosphingobium sp. G106]
MTRAVGSNEGRVVAVHSPWKWFLGLGAALWIFGIIASAKLFLATVGAAYFLGVMMFVSATLQLIHARVSAKNLHQLCTRIRP